MRCWTVGEDLIAPWLAAQTLPMFPIDVLGTGPLPVSPRSLYATQILI